IRVCEPLVAVVVFQETAKGAAVSSVPSAAPSSKNCTPTTPTLSEALAVTVIVPETVAPPAGEVMLTVGAVVSLATVIVTGAEVVRLPAASRATAARVCGPLTAVVVSIEIEYGATVSSAPTLAPSTLNWTPATPTLSAALADTVIVPETVAPFAGEVMLTVGAVVSLATVIVTGAEVMRLPAASRAATVRVCEPLVAVVVFQETAKGAAVSSVPSAAPSSKNCTPATPTLSAALAVTVSVPETVAPLAGELMLTVGGVVSGGGPFETLTVTGAEVVRL